MLSDDPIDYVHLSKEGENFHFKFDRPAKSAESPKPFNFQSERLNELKRKFSFKLNQFINFEKEPTTTK
jgi:hypothetical protein